MALHCAGWNIFALGEAETLGPKHTNRSYDNS